MPQYRNLERPWVVSSLLVAAVIAVYLPAIYLKFINFDDTFYVTRNRLVQGGLTWDALRWAFTHAYAANWHPLTWISHMLDCQVYGLTPVGHHLTNVLFHAANSALLFLWLRSVTGAVWRSGLVAALFALHPLHVETVAWVAERKDVLSTFFFILTLIAYGRAKGEGQRAEVPSKVQTPTSKVQAGERSPDKARNELPRSIYYLLSLALFALGLMSKPMLVTLPFVLLLLDYWPLRRMESAACRVPRGNGKAESRKQKAERPSPLASLQFPFSILARLVWEKAPFFVLSTASCIVTFYAQRQGGAVASVEGEYGISMESRIANVPISYVRYLLKLVWPRDLAVIYPFVRSWPEEWIALSVVFLLLLSGLALWQAGCCPYLPVGWFWYLGTLVPVIGLVQVGTQSIADRYTYIPAIGVFIVVAWGTGDLADRLRGGRVVFAAGAGAVLLAFAHLAGRQLLYWQNSESLFRHALAVTKNNYMAESNLGSYFSELGDLESAKACYRAALRVAPNHPNTWNNLGCALVAQKRYEEAIEAFSAVLRAKPLSADAQSNLGNALFGLGRIKEAIEHYREAVRIDPQEPLAHYNLGLILFSTDRFAEAIEEFRAAVKLNPQYVDAHNSLANALARQGKPDEAEAEFKRALETQPESVPALNGLGSLLADQGKWDQAALRFSEVARLRPNDGAARVQLGLALAAQGKLDTAVQSFSEALRIRPKDATARYHLAVALSGQHKFKEATGHYREVLKRVPDFPEALNNLAWILAANPDPDLRNGREAVELAERACRLTENKQAIMIGTLAAAYAEAGRFPEAVTAAEKARAIAEQQNDKELAAKNGKLLELYRAARPYRDAP
jgi:tetratricopeptide (TPR) repeat protein